jgi:acyl-CoA synthetase (AMP-forming)/AMP-acid ligase II
MLPIDLLYRSAVRNPDKVAVETDYERLTYGELVRRVDAVAAGIQATDPTPGGRVAISAHNTVQHLIALLATLAAGRTWIALNPRNGRAELDAFLAAARPSLVIVDEDCLGRFSPTGAALIVGRTGAPSTAGDTLAGLVARFGGKRPARADPDLGTAQAMKMTGGSTGRPKIVVQSHRCWNAVAISQIMALGLAADERMLLAAPLTHGTGQYVLPTLAQGGTLFPLVQPRPADVLEALAGRGVTAVFLPPTLIYMMLAEAGAADSSYPALRHLVYAGAPMRTGAIRRARAVFNGALETSYGQAEAPQIMAFQSAAEFADERNLTAVGRPTALTRLAIMGADGRLLETGEEGEIVARGDLLMNGYLDDPEATAATIRDGWLHTGDLGAFDEWGRLFIKGRSRDIIITGGFNVFPADVETALGRHPAVCDCVVFGVADEKWGERIEAAVELNQGMAPTPEALIAFAKAELDSVKAPKAVHIFADLPRSPVGKVQRREAKAAIYGPGGAQVV